MIESKIGIQNKVRIIHNVGINNSIDLVHLCNKSKTHSRLELHLKERLKSFWTSSLRIGKYHLENITEYSLNSTQYLLPCKTGVMNCATLETWYPIWFSAWSPCMITISNLFPNLVTNWATVYHRVIPYLGRCGADKSNLSSEWSYHLGLSLLYRNLWFHLYMCQSTFRIFLELLH